MKCQNCGLENCFELYFCWFGVYIEPIVGAYVAEYDISEARCANCGYELSYEEVEELFEEINVIKNS
ncbi:hypothetical protein Calkro_0700 [Caldicellulosiruptor kronotskyensis 2002]|uniref:Uncharacterized protein n=1 Tax=Caldicellulosiruptor kronotskyensis (strain DSM 18902 / VKM B-2412 / 2002) TaxID=632348 RepID=E4SEV4_CALK2|nr:hypothetical protein [Caldicellulosiruptor kronotskyensis]ADQ45591.1 hypothetical protein Calkro_0700 [Caldicellulosiruptor kronotskyensis 2002]